MRSREWRIKLVRGVLKKLQRVDISELRPEIERLDLFGEGNGSESWQLGVLRKFQDVGRIARVGSKGRVLYAEGPAGVGDLIEDEVALSRFLWPQQDVLDVPSDVETVSPELSSPPSSDEMQRQILALLAATIENIVYMRERISAMETRQQVFEKDVRSFMDLALDAIGKLSPASSSPPPLPPPGFGVP
jgi:hypothetical protein